MTEIREIPIQFPSDDAHCKLIADQLAATGFHELARQLRVAVMPKPAIEEPKEFGSLVRADRLVDGVRSATMLWHRIQINGMRYWQSETGNLAMWSELTDVAVLRVGLVGAIDYTQGIKDTVGAAIARLVSLKRDAITSERKNALEKAIQAVEELAP